MLTTALDYALDAALDGYAVFPVSGKVPSTPHGYKDASRDRERITALFNDAPRATGYGIACGAASGVVVVDVDGPEARAEAERLGLRSDYVVRTGRERDGWHLYFTIPGQGVEVKGRTLAPGVELKGHGHLVVGPGSLHPSGRRYRVVKDGNPCPAPEWMLEPPLRGAADKISSSFIFPDLDGPPIPEGARDTTMTRIAGKLHDGTRTLDRLTADLLMIRDARCDNPETFTDDEVRKIARSIHAKPPCRPSEAQADPATLEALARFESEHLPKPYPGMAGKSDRDTIVALTKLARPHGTLTPSGVRISVGVRALAVEAGVSKKSLTRKGGVLARLKASGIIRSDNAGRGATEAGAFILLDPAGTPRAKGTHTASGGDIEPRVTCGYPLRAPRLRWGYPGVRRLGKTRGAMVDTLEAAGGSLRIEALAAALHHKRPRDMRRRLIPPLEKHAVVEVVGDVVSLTSDYLEAVERRREATGEIAAETRDRERNRRKSAERRERLAGRDTRIPVSEAELAARADLREIAESEGMRRSWRTQRRALRDPRALERIPDLRGSVDRRVRTPRGEGKLWDHKGEEARVILDAVPNRWTPIDVADVEVLEAV